MWQRVVCAGLFVLLAVSLVSADPVQVDLSQSGDVEEGWIDWNSGSRENNVNLSRQFLNEADFDDDFTIEFIKVDTRNRAQVDDTVPLHDLLDDAFKEGDPFDMVITDLNSGLYAITTYHHDPLEDVENDDGTLKVTVTDADGTRTVVEAFQQTWGPNPGEGAVMTFMFRSDGTSDITINFADNNDGVHNEAFLNGFELDRAVPPELASSPDPERQAVDVPVDVVLSWTPGEGALAVDGHRIYFGTVFEDVNEGAPSALIGIVSEPAFDTASLSFVLAFDTTYYWRIDEADGLGGWHIGEVWSFTTEPFAYAVEGVIATSNAPSDAGVGPENTVNGSGLNESDQHSIDAGDMWLAKPSGADPVSIQFEFDRVYKLHELWVWNYNVQFEIVLGFGLKDVTVEYSVDGTEWAVLGDVALAQGTATADYAHNTTVAFNGVGARFVRLTVASGWGVLPQFGLSEVRFFYIPAHAREPEPADGTADVDPNPTLTWRAGREAVSHEIHLSTDRAAVAEGAALVDAVAEAPYAPAALEFGSTYFWKIDEVNEAEAISVWEGDVWSFATVEFAVIDDMESYDDEENRIYDTWLDGLVNETGATVGYFEAPFTEERIVNGGKQSMPFAYDNSVAPFYSEAERDLGSVDLAANGADSLRLFVSGQAPAFFETADGSILMNGIGADIVGTADAFRYGYKQLTGNGSMTARVEAVDGRSNTWAKGGVMIRQNTKGGAVNVFMAMTGGSGGGATFQHRPVADGATEPQYGYADGPFAPPYWVRVTREGHTFKGYTSPDGETWTQRGDTVTVDMTDPVLIGLALTSHNSDQANSAEFSNVSFTGNVSAEWQIAEIGTTQPEGNVPEPLFLAVEDTSGHVAVVTHPDAAATARPGWNEWVIRYSDLDGVDLSGIATLFIGVGDRDNPSAGGTGLIFVDDIGYGRPAP